MEKYIVSALKYRPQNFSDVVGQESLITTLKNSIITKKLAHAYLFSGPRGVGKTTCARIFAKSINCLASKNDGEACGKCESCLAFQENRSMNIFELDAASNNSVDYIRLIIEKVAIPPQIGQYKVFIIDEVHMLSQAAFNAFLKTLEEPPAHVIFILATTEKQKVPATVLSRCQSYDFKRMSVSDITNHLQIVSTKEGYTAENEALIEIAKMADGGMRDALSIFDQIASYSEGNITYKDLIEDFGLIDSSFCFQIVDSILNKNIPEEMILLDSLLNKGVDGRKIINIISNHFRDIFFCKNTQTSHLVERSDNDKQKLVLQANQLTTNQIIHILSLCNLSDLNYKNSKNKRLFLELKLIEITQTLDNDSPSSGHGPKELQPIFKTQTHLAKTKKQKVIKQNDIDKPKVANNSIVKQQSVLPPPPNDILPKMQRSVSIYGTMQQESTNISAKEDTIISYGKKPFTDLELKKEWMRYAQRLPVEKSAFSARMISIEPMIGDNYTINIPVSSPLVQSDFTTEKNNIERFLQQQLHNDVISLNIFIKEANDINFNQPYTEKEKWKVMLDKNKAFTKLCTSLNLELE